MKNFFLRFSTFLPEIASDGKESNGFDHKVKKEARFL
jgi:hypothetical protein